MYNNNIMWNSLGVYHMVRCDKNNWSKVKMTYYDYYF